MQNSGLSNFYLLQLLNLELNKSTYMCLATILNVSAEMKLVIYAFRCLAAIITAECLHVLSSAAASNYFRSYINY